MIEVDKWKRTARPVLSVSSTYIHHTPNLLSFGKGEEMREVVIRLFDHQTAVVIVGTTGMMCFDVSLWWCCQKI